MFQVIQLQVILAGDVVNELASHLLANHVWANGVLADRFATGWADDFASQAPSQRAKLLCAY